MKIGVNYYPEHWDKALWAADADLMKKTGVQIVRMAEFAWSRMEPREGEFDFAWLDEAVALFAECGIEVILGTPTSCPPMWLYEKHPDIVQIEPGGQPIRLGIRGHRCVTNPTFLKYADRITVKMAEHYAGNPAVTGWQIDNELEAYHCCCPHCAARFRAWLKAKHGSIEAVNRAYGKSDYIPAIAWGRNARYAGEFAVGDRVAASGRMQSRVYRKVLEDGRAEDRVAYEVSLSRIEKLP